MKAVEHSESTKRLLVTLGLEPTTQYLTTEEVGGILRLSPQTIRVKIQEGQLEAIQPGRKWLVTVESLASYLEEHYGEMAK